MRLEGFVDVDRQAAVILREAGFARILRCSQWCVEGVRAKGVPKLNLWELWRPCVELGRQSERGRLEWVTLDNVPSGISNEEQFAAQDESRRENVRVTQNPKHAVIWVEHIGACDIVSVKARRLNLSLVLVGELPVDTVICVDVVIDANSPLVGGSGCARRRVEVKPTTRILWRRPVVSGRKFIRQWID